jgi:SLA1 homology domain 1, SHD1
MRFASILSRHFFVRSTVLVFCAIAIVSVSLAEMRMWTDSSGKHKIEAEFKSLKDGKVTLLKPDGKIIRIDLEKLSTEDQQLANKLAENPDPFEEVEDSPFDEAESDDDDLAEPQGRIVKVDSSGLEILPTMASNDEWKFDVKVPSEDSDSEEKPKVKFRRRITIPPKQDFFEKVSSVVVKPESGLAMIGYRRNDFARGHEHSRLVLCDLAKGNTVELREIDREGDLLDLSDDGKEVLMLFNGREDESQLEIWKIDGKKTVCKFIWEPYREETWGPNRKVKWARYISGNRLATLNPAGKLAIWDVNKIKPLYFLEVNGECVPALSPDRKYIAFATRSSIGILDLAKKDVVAMNEMPEDLHWPRLAFSPGCTRIACVDSKQLYVLDSSNGVIIQEMKLNINGGSKGVSWVDEKYLLLRGHVLIDVPKSVQLWDYYGAETGEAIGGLAWFFICRGHQNYGAMVPAKIPQSDIDKQLKKAMQNSDFFVLKPGVTVKLNLDGLRGEKESIAKKLTDKLEKLDFKVGDNGTIELIASVEDGEPDKKVSYGHFHRFRDKIFTMKEYITRMKFVYDGKTAWERRDSNIPHFIDIKDDESVKDALRRHEKPDYSLFNNVDFPIFLMKPGEQKNAKATFGRSEVTVNGISKVGKSGPKSGRRR